MRRSNSLSAVFKSFLTDSNKDMTLQIDLNRPLSTIVELKNANKYFILSEINPFLHDGRLNCVLWLLKSGLSSVFEDSKSFHWNNTTKDFKINPTQCFMSQDSGINIPGASITLKNSEIISKSVNKYGRSTKETLLNPTISLDLILTSGLIFLVRIDNKLLCQSTSFSKTSSFSSSTKFVILKFDELVDSREVLFFSFTVFFPLALFGFSTFNP
ncbi:hypothetical protein AGLY_014904 [Aphis glycines]|uniref:Uncharacterized protein n=1 Tax=Aphis glycines TaxID=307491 RepID=A0A6G0T3T3_APHGL|nr:hypothetical protein AGLY_014904 [Aphis glycines]